MVKMPLEWGERERNREESMKERERKKEKKRRAENTLYAKRTHKGSIKPK
jgi:hypothetical protein